MTVRATAYLTIQAVRYRYGRPDPETGMLKITGAKVVKSTQSRPERLERDQIAVKVTVEIPEAAFDPISPAAVIVVPTDLALRGPIDVEALDANPEEGS